MSPNPISNKADVTGKKKFALTHQKMPFQAQLTVKCFLCTVIIFLPSFRYLTRRLFSRWLKIETTFIHNDVYILNTYDIHKSMLSKASNYCIAVPLSTCIHVFQCVIQVWPHLIYPIICICNEKISTKCWANTTHIVPGIIKGWIYLIHPYI